MLRYSRFKILTNLGSPAGNPTTKRMSEWFTWFRCFHSFHEVKNKRMQRNISQHKQQNAVQNECWLMSMPMSLQRNLGERRTCNQRNLYCVHTTDCSYRHFQQHRGQEQGEFQGKVKMRRKLTGIHLCRHFQQETNHLYIYYKFSPCFWGPASHHWPSPDGKGKEDVGRKKKKDQDSEANNVINISLFSANIYLLFLLYYIWNSIARKEDDPQEGGVLRIWHHLKLYREVTDYSFMMEKLNSWRFYSKAH